MDNYVSPTHNKADIHLEKLFQNVGFNTFILQLAFHPLDPPLHGLDITKVFLSYVLGPLEVHLLVLQFGQKRFAVQLQTGDLNIAMRLWSILQDCRSTYLLADILG